MTTINSITSDVQTTFSSVPTVQTQLSTDNSTKLASIGYVTGQSLTSSSFLDIGSAQTVTGTYTINNQPTFTTIDTPIAGTLSLGNTETEVIIEPSVAVKLKTFAQTIYYWAVGNARTAPALASTGTYVSCQKVQTGQISLASSSSAPVTFSPAFTSRPSILLGVQSTGTTVFTPATRYITFGTASATGFTANYGSTGATLVLNWIAIGT
jgi:hypothetical protein